MKRSDTDDRGVRAGQQKPCGWLPEALMACDLGLKCNESRQEAGACELCIKPGITTGTNSQSHKRMTLDLITFSYPSIILYTLLFILNQGHRRCWSRSHAKH